ncbi:vascular endothelial growth factor A isoform X2 [Rana temporaria]|uniref:vascular endothelial growth factor A isoform X2 n=1 Tax=Rana temporaria TaxID=8407 RepID=UPI001AADA947|nr:vascular endothelial growth factor A isoform X2 [Rana temporaria]
MLLGTMNFLLSVLWGLPFLLSIHTAQLSQAAPTHGKEHKSTQVVPFMEVYDRSMCQVREILVDVLQEYPDEVEYIFKPSCVPLMRCAGCCTDETLECVPTGWHNITMQILRVHSRFGANYLEKSFQQHSRCECRPKNEIKGQQEKKAKRGKGLKRKRKKIRPCEPCTDTERRKHLFVQDPQTCKCSCKNTDSRCKTRQLELNERTCRRGKKPRAVQPYGAPLSADLAH